MSTISLTRLNKEYENLTKDPPEHFVAGPIKDDMFCWHFTIRGPDDSEFEGGLYHGVIKLPTAYPHKPPNVMFLTTNGRYDTKMNICLSMTKYHKEEWQAAWTIRSMLEAIIAFMPVKEDHEAIGAIDASSDLRKRYAALSVNYVCETCGPIVNLISPKVKSKQGIKEEKKSDKEIGKEKEQEQDDDEQSHSTSSKKKKIDQHQRIKGVIVEDSHEDDIEEENKLKKGSHLSKLKSHNEAEDNNNNNSTTNKNDHNNQLKPEEEDKEAVDFQEFFKKMRTNQYRNENNAETINDAINNNKFQSKEDEEDINVEVILSNKNDKQPSKSEDKIQKQQQHNANEKEIPLITINTATKTNINTIANKESQIDEKTQVLIDELEFQQLMGTIKCHKTKSNEEIESIVKKECIEERRQPKEMIKGAFHCAENLLANQKELEKLLKSQVRNMKTYTKLLYEEGQKKRLRIINCILTVSIIIIFVYFWIIRPNK